MIVNVIVGNGNPHKSKIEDYCAKYDNWNYYCQISNMAELMAKADLAIGAGGTTTWERCYLGLPTIVIAVAENQREFSEACLKAGVIKYLGMAEDVTVCNIKNVIVSCSIQELEMMKNACYKLMGNACEDNELLEACCL